MRRFYVSLLVFFGLLFFSASRAYSLCTVSAGANFSICNGQSSVIRTTVTGSPTTYTWTSVPAGVYPADDSLIISPAVNTTYHVVISGGGCNASANVTVAVLATPAVPAITFNPNNSCSGSTVSFSVPAQAGVTFTWNFGDGTNANGRTQTHHYTTYGSGSTPYTVTVVATNASGCSSSSSQVVTVVQEPHALLTAGPGVTAGVFQGVTSFHQCTATVNDSSNFNFNNAANPNTGVTSTIIWGDGSANYVSATNWTTISHFFHKGIDTMKYIVTDNTTGCSDTISYLVFYGSNPAGGLAQLGSTNICGPGTLPFLLTNFQQNLPGTLYTITFGDSTPAVVFGQPPPDTVYHTFVQTSCGQPNDYFTVSLTVQNPCGPTGADIRNIYVTLPPVAKFIGAGSAVCANSPFALSDSSTSGDATSGTCTYNAFILWEISPATGWTLNSGTLGTDNGMTDPNQWTVGSPSVGLTFTTQGSYQVSIIAANNCYKDTFTRTICATGLPVPGFSLAPNIGCAPLNVTTTNTTPANVCSPISYSWIVNHTSFTCNPDSFPAYYGFSGGTAAAPVIQLYNEGVYSIAMSAQNVCGAVNAPAQTVTVKDRPQITMNVPANVCPGQIITPTSTALPCTGTISAYNWTFQGGTPPTSALQNPGTVSMNTTGNHNVSLAVTNECGTNTLNTVIVIDTAPVAIAGPAAQYCSGDSVQLGVARVAGNTYLWTPATGLSSDTVANPWSALIDTGTTSNAVKYHLKVTNVGGCSTLDSVTITVFPPATVIAGPPDTICSGLTVNLNGSFGGAATSVIWTSSNGGTFSNIHSPTSTYTPTITNGTVVLTLTTNTPAGPCPASKDTVTVTVLPPPVAHPGNNDSVCNGASVQIGGISQPGYNYTWTPATDLNATNVSSPIATLSNTSDTVQSQRYTLVVSLAGCVDSGHVTVYDFPNASANAGNPVSVCAGDSVLLTGTISGATSSTWSSASGTFSHPDSLATEFTPTITSGSAVATITTNAPSTVCPVATSSVIVTVNAIPAVTNNPLSQNSCSGSPTPIVAFSSNTGGTTFSWTASSPNGITGFTVNGNSSFLPAQTLVNPSASVGFVIYAVTPNYAGCPGPTVNDTTFVYPLPAVTLPASQTICSGTSSTVATPTSTTAGTTFSWTAVSSGNLIGYTSSGTGPIPVQTVTNIGSVLDSVTYTVTPAANGCPGPPSNYSILVYPSPNVNFPVSQAICSGASTTAVVITSNVAGATLAWTATGSAGVTGFPVSGNGNIPVLTLNNTSTSTGTVTFAVTATANNCSGPPANYVITVNPIPVISAVVTADTICPGTQTNITLSSNVAGTNFTWTAIEPAGVTGAFNGNGATIQQVISNTNNSLATVTYYITPTANACNGNPDTINIVVLPGAAIVFSLPNQTICSGQSSQQVLITSPSPGVSFSWTSTANGITGVTATGTTTIPVQTLVNATTGALTANYTVAAGYAGCTSQTSTYNITVNPIPQDILPASQFICSGTASQGIVLASTVFGTTFAWSGSTPNGVTGFTANGTGNLILSQTLTNSSAAPGIVVYVVTPTAAGCPGPSANDTITVNPLPAINALVAQTICSGATSAAVALGSATAGTTYGWNVTYSGNISGYTSTGTGNIPPQTLTNGGFTIDSVVYTITPTANNCNGPAITYALTVNPTPNVLLPGPQTICSNASTTLVNITSSVAGATFAWTAAGTAGITGFTANGTGNIPVQTITNPGNTAGTVTYTITPTANTCPGPNATYTVTINPLPIATAVPVADTICPATQTNIALSSTVANTSFSWVATGPASVSGFANGSGSQIQQVLSNGSTSPQTVSYLVTPLAGGCPGPNITTTAVVYPNVSIQFSPAAQTVCSGLSSQLVNITSPSPGVNFQWTSLSAHISGVAASGTNTIPVQLLVDSITSPSTIVYTVLAGYTGCPDVSANYNIAVYPTPVDILPPSQTICSGSLTQSIALNATVPGTTFTWSGTSPNGVTGFTPGGTSSLINSQILTNTAAVPGMVVYSVIPTASGCVGASANDTINANPLPSVISIPAQTICSDSTGTIVTPVSATPGTTFNWAVTHSGNLSGFTITGSGNIPAQTVHSNSSFIDSVVYTITPTASGCIGPASNFDIIVNPSPDVILPPAQTICSNASSIAAGLSSSVAGTTYAWTATATNGITGFTATGTGNIPVQTLNNPSNTPGTVTCAVTPTASGCPGLPRNYVITVNPIPTATALAAQDTICDEAQTSIALTSNVAGTTFSWTANEPASVTGAAIGSGNSIQQILTNNSTSWQTVNYYITPLANGCSGPPDTVNIIVRPGVSIQFAPGNQTICTGQTSQQVAITSTSPNVNFAWTSQANGVTGVAASGTNSIPVQTLTNSSNAGIVVVYLVTAGYATCTSQTSSYEILVNPSPQDVLPAPQTICSNTSSAPVNLNATVTGSTFAWTASSVNGVTGFTPAGTSSIIPAQTLVNPAFTAGTVTYVVTPTANSCPGLPSNYVITVNPLPNVIVPAPQTICNGASSSVVNLASSVTGATFSWTSLAESGITGNTTNGNGNISVQTLQSSRTDTGVVLYTITATAAGCSGPDTTYPIIVEPSPTVVFAPAPQILCSGQSSTLVNITSATPGASITWTAVVPAGITGAITSGTTTIPVQTFSNNTVDTIPQPLVITYTAQVSTSGTVCPGTAGGYSISVEPVPVISFLKNDTGGCSPVSINFTPNTLNFGVPDSLVFNWGDGTANDVLYPGTAQPLWHSVAHVFYNNTNQTAIYNVALIAHSNCIDTSIIQQVTILPGQINAFFTASPTTGCAPLTVTLHDQSNGAAILSWCYDYDRANDSCLGGGAIDVPGSTIQHSYGAGTHTIALFVNNGGGGCAHDSSFQVITVTGAPTALFTGTNNICAQSTASFTEQAISPAGSNITQFNWQFGDGDSSSLNNPTHVFDTAGTYSICMKVTSSFGCTDSICQPINVLNKPDVSFSSYDTCVNTQPIQFVNTSVGALFYSWDFGDGNTSVTASPANNYLNPGMYFVTLVGSTNTCSDTITDTVFVRPIPAASFTIPVTYSCGIPSSLQLSNTTTGALGYAWDFGNGTTSIANNPIATYNAQGTYVISLAATNQFHCVDTARLSVTVYPYPVIQSVNVSPAEGCQPLNVLFNVNATNANHFNWNFGDGSSTATDSSYTTHTYTDTGTYSVLLQVYSYSTCGDTLLMPDTVIVHINPTAAFSYNLNENVEPENGTVLFTNASLNSTSYVWNFGDGTTSTDVNPSHLFPDISTYQVTLLASTKYGCVDSTSKEITVIKKSIYVPNAFAPDFTGSNALVKIWLPAGMGLKTYHAQIFNKWGELLWESTALTADYQPAEGWNGTYQGKECQQDVYVWKIEATYLDGTRWQGMSYAKDNNPVRKTIGSVTLIR